MDLMTAAGRGCVGRSVGRSEGCEDGGRNARSGERGEVWHRSHLDLCFRITWEDRALRQLDVRRL